MLIFYQFFILKNIIVDLFNAKVQGCLLGKIRLDNEFTLLLFYLYKRWHIQQTICSIH